MAAHLYIASLYEKRRDEFKLEELRAAWQSLRERYNMSTTPDDVHAAWKAYDDAGNEALKGCYWSDEYNQQNLFWLFGMDHWTEASHTIGGTMPIKRIKELRSIFATGDIQTLVDRAAQNGRDNVGMQPGSPKRKRPEIMVANREEHDGMLFYFSEKRDALVALFDQAIALDEGIRWST